MYFWLRKQDAKTATRPVSFASDQLQADLIAHLCFAAVELRGAELRRGDDVVRGRLGPPDFERLVVPFMPRTRVPGSIRGARVEVHYGDEDDHFQFETEVAEVGGTGVVFLRFPRSIESDRSRLTRRHRARGGWNFVARRAGRDGRSAMLAVHDLSAAGLGLVFDAGRVLLREHQTLAGTLISPDRERLPLRVETRRVMPHGTSEVMSIVGCALSGAGLDNILRVAKLARDVGREAVDDDDDDEHDFDDIDGAGQSFHGGLRAPAGGARQLLERGRRGVAPGAQVADSASLEHARQPPSRPVGPAPTAIAGGPASPPIGLAPEPSEDESDEIDFADASEAESSYYGVPVTPPVRVEGGEPEVIDLIPGSPSRPPK